MVMCLIIPTKATILLAEQVATAAMPNRPAIMDMCLIRPTKILAMQLATQGAQDILALIRVLEVVRLSVMEVITMTRRPTLEASGIRLLLSKLLPW